MSVAVVPELLSSDNPILEEEPVRYQAGGDAGVTCLFQDKDCHHTSKIHIVIFRYGIWVFQFVFSFTAEKQETYIGNTAMATQR